MEDRKVGIATNWLRHVQDVAQKHAAQLEAIADPTKRAERLSELNSIEQAVNLSQTTIVREAWAKGQPLTVHAWIYGIGDGLLRDLKITASGEGEVAEKYRAAVG
jgi:carbonic anhydrase